MPTPSSRSRSSERLIATPPLHNSCPPDDDRLSWRSLDVDRPVDETTIDTSEMIQQPTPPPSDSLMAGSTERHLPNQREPKIMDVEEEIGVVDILSPISIGGISVEGEKQEESDIHPLSNSDMRSPSTGYDFSNIRLIPSSPSPYLRAGSKFKGNQQSERQVYDVQVEIKHVDMRESFLCGYLRIQGLTEDHPTLTTYFEGEILGTKYNFHTQHEDWGSNKKSDLQHWGKFLPFKPFKKQVEKGNFNIPNMSQRETIFMRWKEHFLVPDHRVRTISGASFEGFYYICFNQIKGTVSGIYFHAKSERFQQLELKHVEDRGCHPAVEFR